MDVREIQSFFESQGPDVLAAYLFGSRANGTATPWSDVDIGIVLNPAHRLDARARFSLRIDLTRELMRSLRWNDVDVVILNDGPPALAATVLAEGTLLLCHDARRLQDFARDVQLRAADLKPFLQRMQTRLLARLRAT
ncbi:MAG TPA: nucleotidyltransferase domain-containing protein [bacterium]|nr:nucleotidyltransferase domain-containing protein [bacterium]